MGTAVRSVPFCAQRHCQGPKILGNGGFQWLAGFRHRSRLEADGRRVFGAWSLGPGVAAQVTEEPPCVPSSVSQGGGRFEFAGIDPGELRDLPSQLVSGSKLLKHP